MNKTVKNLINKTIELEYYRMDKEDVTGLNKFEDYKEISDKYCDIEEKIYKILPIEYHELIDELVEISTTQLAVEKRYAFKKGVIEGLTDLKYLNDDIGQQIKFI